MKKNLPPAKAPLPKFRSDKEAAEYFEEHSVAQLWDQLPEGKPAKPSSALSKSIQERHAAAKSPLSIRLVPGQIAAAKKIAGLSPSATRPSYGCGSLRGFAAKPSGGDIVARCPTRSTHHHPTSRGSIVSPRLGIRCTALPTCCRARSSS